MNDVEFNGGNVPIAIVARVMKKSTQFVRIGIQTGKLPFGTAIKSNAKKKQFDYYVSPKLFFEYTGFLYEPKRKDITYVDKN